MADARDQIVAAARSVLGDRYVYGATGPSTFDCSGLVLWTFGRAGISMPRTSQEQYKVGTPITRGELAPGDLVFSAGSDGTPSAPGHVAIYIGNGQVIAAPHTGADVRVQSVDSLSPTGYRRPPGLGAGGGGGTAVPATDTSALGGLLSFPGEVVQFFSDATDDLSATAGLARSLFQPSTYVRIGSGLLGLVLLIAGLFFLVREAQSGA